MLKLFFSVKLSLIFNTATVTDITTDHNFHGHSNMKTFTYEKISHLSLVHSVGKWCTLGREKGFQLVTKSFTRIFLISDAVRDLKEQEATHHMSEGKINVLILHGYRLSDLRLLL